MSRQYKIIPSTFCWYLSHETADKDLGLRQASFMLIQSSDPLVKHPATVYDVSTLTGNLRQGDTLMLEVVRSSTKHDIMQVPQ